MSNQESVFKRSLAWLATHAVCMSLPLTMLWRHLQNFGQAAWFVAVTSMACGSIGIAFGLIEEGRSRKPQLALLVTVLVCMLYAFVLVFLATPLTPLNVETERTIIAISAVGVIVALLFLNVWSGTEVAGLPTKLVLPISTANIGLFIWSALSPQLFPRILYSGLLILVAGAYIRRIWREAQAPS